VNADERMAETGGKVRASAMSLAATPCHHQLRRPHIALSPV